MAFAHTPSTSDSGKGMLVIIDPAIRDYDFLAASVLPGARVVVLDKNQDAIAQITAALYDAPAHRTYPYDSVHLIAPNSPGILHFSSGDLSIQTLDKSVEKLQTWFAAEAAPHHATSLEPQLLLYGRKVGAGQSGTELIDTLSWLTGAAVIASKNGDRWPNTDGSYANLAFAQSVQQSYQGTFSA